MRLIRNWLRKLRGRAGQSTTEYMLTISVLSIAAMAATFAAKDAYRCMFTGNCTDFNETGGVPQVLADSLTKDGIQGVGNGQFMP